MALLSEGNRGAFELLYNRYFNKLVWFAKSFLNDQQKAEDAVQEVFIKLIERHQQFDATKKFSTWIYTITGNQCKQIIRNEENRLRILKDEVIVHAPKAGHMRVNSDHRLLKEKLDRAYETFSEKEKSIYILRFEQELSIKEISEITGLAEGSVKSGIFYLLKKLSVHLKEFKHEN